MIDVLIVGSGASGLTAALEAKKNNVNVLVVSKTYPTHSQTVQAQGGINAVLYEDYDSVDIHTEDTYKASCGLSDVNNIKYMCQNAKETINWLDSIGVPFTRNENSKISQRKFGGTKKIRTCYSSDYTGLKILHTLYDQCIKNNIEFVNEHQLLNLIIEENKCIGITALDIVNGVVKEYISKTVIIATGGYAGLYTNFTTNSYSNTGDGLVSVYKAGGTLSNIEFIQFHPTALENTNILISESARGEGGYLLDKDKNRFIDELKPRDEVARAIYERIQKNEKVYLDLRHLGKEKINKLMPQEKRLAYEFSQIDLENDLLPINPAAHYSMGGIKSDINCKTTISNLYAVGECAQQNVHGANRLGGNSLLEVITFGKVAGHNASIKSKEIHNVDYQDTKQFFVDKNFINDIFTYTNEINFYERKEKLGIELFKNVGLFRKDSTMNETLNFIIDLKSSIKKMGIGDKSKYYNKNLVEFIEFINMIDLAEVLVSSAILRCESRGSHYRIDYPFQVESLKMNSFAYLNDNKLYRDFEDII